jgi:SCP-2 sterol transfer family
MSTPASSSGHPGDAVAAPSGLVTVIVGEAGRTSSRSRSRQGANRARSARGAGGASGTDGEQSPAQEGDGVTRWSRQWTGDGPGPVLPGNDEEPDLTLTIGTDDARRIKNGELDPSVAFMQGKLKSSGDNALLLRILDWSTAAGPAKALGWPLERPG